MFFNPFFRKTFKIRNPCTLSYVGFNQLFTPDRLKKLSVYGAIYNEPIQTLSIEII